MDQTKSSVKLDLLPLSHNSYNAQLFRSAMFADCTIHSGPKVWHLHRCILSPRCEFFWSCFQGSFEEARTASIEMHDDDPETLERMLKWIYCLDYPSLSNSSTPWTAELMLYLLADKYGLTKLMAVAEESILTLAVKCTSKSELLEKTVDDFCEVIQLLFMDMSTREDLKSLQAELLSTMAPVIAKQMRVLPELENLMTSVDGFGLALVEALSNQGRRPSIVSTGSSSLSSTSSSTGSAHSPATLKPYIPLNEDSEDEFA